jgi:lipopolysaccharide transport system permease protein
MNPHTKLLVSPFDLIKNLLCNRHLIIQMIRREVIGRYKGSIFGLAWSFFNPIVMLAVYTFVFSYIFKSRWVGGSDSKTEFALVLFSGLMVFNLFSECVNRAPGLILSNVNYVKKVVFPLEILPVVALGASLFHFVISLIVWVGFYLIFFGLPNYTIIYLPLVIFPIVLMTLGFSWFLASLGVYLRDVGQIIGIITTVLMFLSPIFYPIMALPEEYRSVMLFSPLTFIVEQTRDIMVWGKGFNWIGWTIYTAASSIIAWLGFVWFQKTRKGFADVL